MNGAPGTFGETWGAPTGPGPTERDLYRALTSPGARREVDEQHLGALGVPEAERPALRAAWARYDAALALEEAVDLAERRRAVLRRVDGWQDTREGMLARVDAVIADLDATIAACRSRRAA